MLDDPMQTNNRISQLTMMAISGEGPSTSKTGSLFPWKDKHVHWRMMTHARVPLSAYRVVAVSLKLLPSRHDDGAGAVASLLDCADGMARGVLVAYIPQQIRSANLEQTVSRCTPHLASVPENAAAFRIL